MRLWRDPSNAIAALVNESPVIPANVALLTSTDVEAAGRQPVIGNQRHAGHAATGDVRAAGAEL